MDWDKLFQRYVWNSQTMPYLTAPDDLNRRQAHSEILFYCLFHGVLFGVVALAALRGDASGPNYGGAYYSFSVVCAAVIFGIMKSYPAVLYLSATPLVGLAYVGIYRLGADKTFVDTILVIGLLLLLLRYSLRIVAVARAYPTTPEVEPEDPFRRD